MKRTILLALGFILSLYALAYDIEQDGIYYNFIDGKNEVAVSGSSKSEVIIPNRIFHEGKEYVVTAISPAAFKNRRDLITVQIGDSVRDVMYEAFSQCTELEKVTFGQKVTTIGESSFYECGKLDSICIPDSVSTICKRAFQSCTNLRYLESGKTLSWFQQNAFAGCTRLERIVFKKPTSLDNEYTNYALYFSDNAFQNSTGMKRIDIEDLTAWCNSSGNGWPSSPLTYGPDLYLNGELITKLVIPENAERIGDYAFQNCPSIMYVELPTKIQVSSYAFNSSHIQTLRIRGGSETHINNAFNYCNNLTTVIAESEIPTTITENTFSTDTYYKGTLYVPVGSKDAYKSAPGWSKFYNIKEGFPGSDFETYVLSINVEGLGGQVSYDSYNIIGDKETFYVSEGTDATITFHPFSNYVLYDVQLNGVSIIDDIVDNHYTLSNISTNYSLDVSFIQNPYYLTIRQTNAATIKKEVKSRERVEIGILPLEGWRITNVMFNNFDVTSTVLSSSSYTTPQITGNSELVITQEPIQNKVSCTISAGGTVSVSYNTFDEGYSEASIPNGEYVSIDCKALNGYSLRKPYVDGTDVTALLIDNTYQYGITRKDIAIQAIFEKEDAKQYNLEIQDADYGTSFIRVTEGQTIRYTIHNIEGWKLNTVSFNGQDVTSDVEDNTYATPAITGNSLLSVSFEKIESSGIKNREVSNIRVYSKGDKAIIENAKVGQVIKVFSMEGVEIKEVKADQAKTSIHLSENKSYIISVGTRTFKIAM